MSVTNIARPGCVRGSPPYQYRSNAFEVLSVCAGILQVGFIRRLGMFGKLFEGRMVSNQNSHDTPLPLCSDCFSCSAVVVGTG